MGPVFTISCPSHSRASGDLIAGTINLDVERAEQKKIVAVKVGLVREMGSGGIIPHRLTGETRHHEKPQSLLQEKTVWKLFDTARDILNEQMAVTFDAVVTTTTATQGKILIIPFLFQLPPTTPTHLPPSFPVENALKGGSVRYYLRVEGQRRHWYLPKMVETRAFPVLPAE